MALTDNLVAFWELDESSGTRVDAHGPHDLTDNNTVMAATGRVGDAATFVNANNEYLSVGDHADLSAGNGDFTLAAWVYLDTKGATREIAGKGDGTGFEWFVSYNGGFDRFVFRTASATAEANATTATDGGGEGGGSAPSADTWYFVVAWHDATNDLIGIATSANGMTAYTQAYTHGIWDSTGDFNIGRNSAYFPGYMDGMIDQVGFWKGRVLTSQERTDLYNSGAGLSYAAMSSGGGATPAPGVGALTLTGPAVGLGFTFCLPDEL
jgi:hypothetical protein